MMKYPKKLGAPSFLGKPLVNSVMVVAACLGVNSHVAAQVVKGAEISVESVQSEQERLGRSDDFTGIATDAKVFFADNWFLAASWLSLTNDDFTFEPSFQASALGIGGYVPMTKVFDLYGILGYQSIDFEFGTLLEQDDSGAVFEGGIRGFVRDELEIQLQVKNQSLDDISDTEFGSKARWFLSDFFAVQAGYAMSDDIESMAIGLYFGYMP